MTQLSVTVSSGKPPQKTEELPPPATQSQQRYRPNVKKSTSDCCLGASIVLIITLLVGGGIFSGLMIYWYRHQPTAPMCNETEKVGLGWKESLNAETVKSNAAVKKNGFTFDDIFDASLRPRSWSGSWVSGDELLYRASDGNVYRYNVADETQEVFIPSEIFDQVGSTRYYVSPDEQYVLFAFDVVGRWRHSFDAKYTIYDRLNPEGGLIPFPEGDLEGQSLQYAGWGSGGNALTFVYGNNLYFQAEPRIRSLQVTTNGQEEVIFNGLADWVYEEDVIFYPGLNYLAPDNQHLVYAEIDDSEVGQMYWPLYGAKDNAYGQPVEIAYPKPGDLRNGELGPNSAVRLFVADAGNPEGAKKQIEPPAELADEDHYFTSLYWRDSSHVFITWQDRVMSRCISVLCDVTTGTVQCSTNLDRTEPDGWIDTPAFWPVNNGEAYLTVLPETAENEEAGNFRHLALVSLEPDQPGSVTFLSKGEQEAISIAGFDTERNIVYYIDTNGDATERHLFRVGTPESDEEFRDPECLTCDFNCSYVSASFSPSGEYYTENCLGPDIPIYKIKQIDSEKEIVMEDNADVRARLEAKDLSTQEYSQIDLEGDYKGDIVVNYPPGFDPASEYPVFIYVYAGPGSQMVTKRFPLGSVTSNWMEYLRGSGGAITASIDGRGSSGRGDKFKFEINRRLGSVEVQDQLALAAYMKNQPFVSNDLPVASYGWSYGGFASAHMSSDSSDTVQCSISGAPVTSFRYYDTAYTERFMGLATDADNSAGYDGTDVMDKVENMRGKYFMLAHGTADDNVHFQQTAQLIRALNDANILFRTSLYIDQPHGVGGSQQRHLYNTMSAFVQQECWGPYTPPLPREAPSKSTTDNEVNAKHQEYYAPEPMEYK